MRGELLGIWAETWRAVWYPLYRHDSAPEDLFCELFRLANQHFITPIPSDHVAEIISDPDESRDAFNCIISSDFGFEPVLVDFLEAAYGVLDDLAGEVLSNQYFLLLSRFVETYSLRYDIRRPCTLCPTLSGIFTSLVRDLQRLTQSDEYLSKLMNSFEEAIRDLRLDRTEVRISSVLQRHFSLLEGIAMVSSRLKKGSLGDLCEKIDTWPHETIRKALKDLYGFASDYPGIRHAGSRNGAVRAIEMRDLLAISVVLAGFTPYLRSTFDAELVYGGL